MKTLSQKARHIPVAGLSVIGKSLATQVVAVVTPRRGNTHFVSITIARPISEGPNRLIVTA